MYQIKPRAIIALVHSFMTWLYEGGGSSSAGLTLMAGKVNAVLAGPTAAAAVEGLVSVCCCQGLTILPPESFIYPLG